MPKTLSDYRRKRRASATPEPMGSSLTPQTGKLFVIQQHHASHLHFDLRLEHDGVLMSWAVPKGPSYDPTDKRFAARVEDHPLDYGAFEGRIPDGNYGAGHVILWDRGTWDSIGSVAAGLEKGKLLFELHGHKLRGRWTLVQMKGRTNQPNEWLLIKEHDAYMDDTLSPPDTSILSGLTVDTIAHPAKHRGAFKRAVRRVSTVPYTMTKAPAPMLASAGEAFDDPAWLFEFKYDGYRMLAEKSDGEVRLLSRNGRPLTDSFPEIVRVMQHLPVEQCVIDGEVVVHDHGGRPSFGLLQQRLSADSVLEVARLGITQPATLWAFDLLAAEGVDLRGATLVQRKSLLQKLLPDCGDIRFSEHIERSGRALFEQAKTIGIEGIVAKRKASTYSSGRSPAWVKARLRRTDDFAIVGYKGRLDDIRSVAVAELRGEEWAYLGGVGSGLTGALRAELGQRLADAPPGEALASDAHITWLTPQHVCEVAFSEYTLSGRLRQPAFQRLRDDKRPEECLGRFAPSVATLAPPPPPEVAVTNPDKVLFPEEALTKKDLVRYYESIAPWMLPYLSDRPIVLTRYPDGIHGKSFYQRDAPDFVPDWIERAVLYSEGAEREVSYFVVRSAEALKYLANMATLPIHSWHSKLDALDQPDWCVLDLDPKEAPFKHVVKLAQGIGELCDELELPAYPKTSGASGLHVLVPLNRQLSHDQSKLIGELLARVIVEHYPDIATIARSVRSREGKVYVDYLQNGHGRLLVAPFSVRAEPAASVSMPLRWHEINGRLSNQRFTIRNAVRRMRTLDADPMLGLLSEPADLLRALSRLQTLLGSGAGR